jgi:hypothetical protein
MSGLSSGSEDSEEDFGIDFNANKPGVRRDPTRKIFRGSYLSGPRVYSGSVFLNSFLLLVTLGAAAKTSSFWLLVPAVSFAAAVYALWRVRTVATQVQFTRYGWIFCGGMISGFVLLAIVAKVR